MEGGPLYKKKNLWRVDNKDLAKIRECINSGLSGKYSSLFEKKAAKKFKRKYAIGLNSGTSALHVALFAVGIKRGDEVIVPPLTFSATAFSVLYLDAKPVFADVDINTFNISPEQIEKKITNKTKAIITVSIFGLVPNMIKIKKIAKKYNLKLIEDNAETIFSKQNNLTAGTFGDLSIMSLQRSKHLTTGDGGVLLTSNKSFYERGRKFSNLGYIASTKKFSKDIIQNPDYFRHEFVAPNYRMPEIIAAMGLSQLEKANMLYNKRVFSGKEYLKILKNFDFVKVQYTPKNFVHSFWTVAFYFKSRKIKWHSFRKKYLQFGGDPFYACWKLSYQEPALKKMNLNKDCKNAEYLQSKLILLKTNFNSKNYSKGQAKILKNTLIYFKNKFKL